MDVERICTIIRELAALNTASAQLARQVMVAQEVADELEHAAELTLDELHNGPPEAAARVSERTLDEAVAAFNAADSAHAAEMSASEAYAAHLERLHRAVEAAQRLVDELDDVDDASPGNQHPPYAGDEPRSRRPSRVAATAGVSPGSAPRP